MDQKKFIVVCIAWDERGGCHRYTLVVAKRIFRLKLVFGMVPLDERDRNNALRFARITHTTSCAAPFRLYGRLFYSRLSDSTLAV